MHVDIVHLNLNLNLNLNPDTQQPTKEPQLTQKKTA
jgi:hypothetical protein